MVIFHSYVSLPEGTPFSLSCPAQTQHSTLFSFQAQPRSAAQPGVDVRLGNLLPFYIHVSITIWDYLILCHLYVTYMSHPCHIHVTFMSYWCHMNHMSYMLCHLDPCESIAWRLTLCAIGGIGLPPKLKVWHCSRTRTRHTRHTRQQHRFK